MKQSPARIVTAAAVFLAASTAGTWFTNDQFQQMISHDTRGQCAQAPIDCPAIMEPAVEQAGTGGMLSAIFGVLLGGSLATAVVAERPRKTLDPKGTSFHPI